MRLDNGEEERVCMEHMSPMTERGWKWLEEEVRCECSDGDEDGDDGVSDMDGNTLLTMEKGQEEDEDEGETHVHKHVDAGQRGDDSVDVDEAVARMKRLRVEPQVLNSGGAVEGFSQRGDIVRRTKIRRRWDFGAGVWEQGVMEDVRYNEDIVANELGDTVTDAGCAGGDVGVQCSAGRARLWLSGDTEVKVERMGGWLVVSLRAGEEEGTEAVHNGNGGVRADQQREPSTFLQ